jgi:hypothetical protein
VDLPKIEQLNDGIRVLVGTRAYLLRINQATFESIFRAGMTYLPLNHDSLPADSILSKAEFEEVRQEIVLDTIYFLSINGMPLNMERHVFAWFRVVRALCQKIEIKAGKRSDRAFELTAQILDVRPDEIRRVIAGRDALENL